NPYNFKDVKRDTAYVALAGPAANFISAIIFSLIFDIKTDSYLIFHDVFKQIIFYTIFINIAFGLFNLIPFPPLDGSRIIGAFLSDEAYFKYQQFERKGVFILIGIILIGNMMGLNIIGGLIIPPINFFLKLLIGVQI
ncbi:MAG: site-2 protease family protein, partial [Candidatus Cloacimonetes bacterium]|nr:site-2 protease family protein [Candidatus Cloacimonadota bacterium]